jgi:APA family basic amino acid/polyamine antiporter
MTVGAIGGILGGCFPVEILGDLLSMGTLLAFASVATGTLILRYKRPSLERPFRVHGIWFVSFGATTSCLYLFWQIFREHGWMLFAWSLAGQFVRLTMRRHRGLVETVDLAPAHSRTYP